MRFIVFFSTLILSINLLAQNYQKLHKEAIVVDTHNDVLSTATMKGLNFENNLSGKTHSDLTRFKSGGVDVQIFSIFCDERFGKDTAFKYANIEIDSLYAIAHRNPGKMMIAKTPADIEKALHQNKLAAMMGLEGGHMIEDNITYLDSFYKRGVRYMTLTWNNSTTWATSAKDEAAAPGPHTNHPATGERTPTAQNQHSQQTNKTTDTLNNQGLSDGHSLPIGEGRGGAGLTDFGKRVVRRMNSLGMMVDLSHVGEQTFWDAIHSTTKPVIVSHSCVYALCPVFRNLKDDQIKAVGKNGGVIDVNFYSGFLDSTYMKRRDAFLQRHAAENDSLKSLNKPSYEIEEYISAKYPAEADALRPPLSLLIDHIDYIVKLIGADHVGLGSDFDGISSAPRELSGVQDFPLITKALLERGYSKPDIKKILGENFIRVFKANSSSK